MSSTYFHLNISLKEVFGIFLFSIKKFYIYIYCRKFNTEFNKLIKTAGHCARFSAGHCARFYPLKNDVEHTHLCQQFCLYFDIFIFSLIKSLSCNKTLKVLGL